VMSNDWFLISFSFFHCCPKRIWRLACWIATRLLPNQSNRDGMVCVSNCSILRLEMNCKMWQIECQM
jgi:hypothetical protein